MGRFPFGAEAGRCEPRAVDNAQLFVLGVYPSALHVRWHAPHGRRVNALAVAPEPYPFWCGEDEPARFATWAARWQPGWGEVAPVGRLNGSSGRSVCEKVVKPLGVGWDAVWLTDALPYFHVHRGNGTQGAAMRDVYDPWAASVGLPPHDLPDRPSPAQLIARAVAEERGRLREEILQSSAPRVVTLGNEALRVLAQIVDDPAGLPNRLSPAEAYGASHHVVLDGRRIEVTPLVHPGQRNHTWRAAHDRWMATAQR